MSATAALGAPPQRSPGGLQAGLLSCTLVLLVMGLVLVYSSSAIYAGRLYDDPQRYVVAQGGYALLGLLGLALAARLPRTVLLASSAWLWCLNLLALVLVLLPGVGHWVGGARRWLGYGRFTCQPSEFCKLTVVLLLAVQMARRAACLENSRKALLWPVLWVQLPIALILAEPDLGTALVLELVLVFVLFAAGLRPRTLVIFGLSVLPIFYHLVVGTPFRLRRLLSYLDPWAYRASSGYQVTEALISIGSGGLWGRGLGRGQQKLFFLPEAHTDFIFAVLAEELGLLGVCVLLTCYALWVWQALELARRATHPFDAYLALGLAALLGIPAIFNTCVATGLLPTKGLPLPFVSYGGSNLCIALLATGLLLRIAQDIATQQTPGRRA